MDSCVMTKVTLLLCLCLGLGSVDGACTEEACMQSDPSVQWSSVLLQRKHIVQPQGDIALAEEEIATSELQGDQAAALSEEKAETDELQARWADYDTDELREWQRKKAREIRETLERKKKQAKEKTKEKAKKQAKKHEKFREVHESKRAEKQARKQAKKQAKKQTKKQTKTTRTRTAKTPAPPPPRVPTTCRCLQCGGAHGPWQSGSCVAQASEVGKSCISNAGHGGCVSSLSGYSCNCPGTVGDRYDV